MKPVLLIDLDGVIVELLPMWLAEYALLSGEHLKVEDITEYHHEKFVQHNSAWWAALEPALEKAKPVPGAIQAIERLREFYDMSFVTYCHPAAPRAAQIKTVWMRTYLGSWTTDRMIFTRQKHIIRGDIMIEDCEENLVKWRKHNEPCTTILVKAPYNPTGWDWNWIEDSLIAKTMERSDET